MKKSAAEAHRMLSNTYGETAISERTCREWFQRFKNGDFDVEDRHSGEKVFEELGALLEQDLKDRNILLFSSIFFVCKKKLSYLVGQKYFSILFYLLFCEEEKEVS